jgi:phage tail-like protein
MAEPDSQYPFVSFNFGVEIRLPDKPAPLCGASFSECDGLEMTMEVKTIREGGNNDRQIRFAGPMAYGQLVLKRGMTNNRDLWAWFADVNNDPSLRANAEVVMFGSEAGKYTEQARFILTRCIPVKLKAPAFNAKDGLIAIEELQVAYEALQLKPKSGGSG